ncbi:MAG: hypothetical protein OXG25_09755 [Gammaproteobacteria bacterium]|nr:hypothetical protein [Gammaproteobacteria bacterium]
MLGRVIAWSAFAVWLRSFWRTSTWFSPVVVAALTIVLISFAHSEYLDLAAAAQTNQHVTLSFVLKWGLIVVVSLVTFFAVLRKRSRKANATSATTQNEQQPLSSQLPEGVDLNRPRSAAERILDEPPP